MMKKTRANRDRVITETVLLRRCIFSVSIPTHFLVYVNQNQFFSSWNILKVKSLTWRLLKTSYAKIFHNSCSNKENQGGNTVTNNKTSNILTLIAISILTFFLKKCSGTKLRVAYLSKLQDGKKRQKSVCAWT